MDRKRQLSALEAARQVGAYEDWPLIPADYDPQMHLSRNDRPQPFHLVCAQDTVLAQVSGQATVEFKATTVLRYQLEPGDHVYVPAGTPHRIVPRTESIQLRYKAREPGLEGVVWYCDGCGGEVGRDEWDTADELPQEGYARACEAFNADPARRTCRACGAEHPPLDLAGFRWREVAATIRANDARAAKVPAARASH